MVYTLAFANDTFDKEKENTMEKCFTLTGKERINKVGAEKEREMSGHSRRRFNINREDEWRARPP